MRGDDRPALRICRPGAAVSYVELKIYGATEGVVAQVRQLGVEKIRIHRERFSQSRGADLVLPHGIRACPEIKYINIIK